jgi:hypothetical protein
MQGPAGIPQQFPSQHDQIGLSGAQDVLGLGLD